MKIESLKFTVTYQNLITNLLLNIHNRFVIIESYKGSIMYEIEFYENKNGKSEIADLIKDLKQRSSTNKECRINFTKIVAYLDLLEEFGTRVGEPVTKHLDGEIWELRPLRNRLLYAYYKDNKFIILHHFIKKTKKTPKREMEQAKRNLQDYLERKDDYAYMERIKK